MAVISGTPLSGVEPSRPAKEKNKQINSKCHSYSTILKKTCLNNIFLVFGDFHRPNNYSLCAVFQRLILIKISTFMAMLAIKVYGENNLFCFSV